MGSVVAFKPLQFMDKLAWLDRIMADPALKPSEKLVAWVLTRFHNDETGQCNPKIDTIVERAGLSRRAVLAAIRALECAGLVRVADPMPGWRSNSYVLVTGRAVPEVQNSTCPGVQNVTAQGAKSAGDGAGFAPKPKEPIKNPCARPAARVAGGAASGRRVGAMAACRPQQVQAARMSGQGGTVCAGDGSAPDGLAALSLAFGRELGATFVSRWWAGVRVEVGPAGVNVVAPSRMVRDYLDGTRGVELRRIMGRVLQVAGPVVVRAAA